MATVKDIIHVLEHFDGETDVKLDFGGALRDVGVIGEDTIDVEEGGKFKFIKIFPMPEE